MRITTYGHSCLHVEDGDASLLIDPGSFSSGFEGLTGLTAVLVTHQHPDHVVPDALAALARANPEAVLVVDPGTSEQIDGDGFAGRHVLRDGESVELAGTTVLGVGDQHATIHPDIPVIPNTGYLVGGRLLHPGDALTRPDAEVEVLAIPAVAPWSKVSETVEYLRAVRPRLAFPIHDGLLVEAAKGVFDGALGNLKDPATQYRRLQEPLEV